MNGKDYQAQLKLEAEHAINKHAGFVRLLEAYPDLIVHHDRWEQTRYGSSKVNTIADQVMICHSCGCCNDSPLFVYPFIEFEGQNVYSEPHQFCVGEKNEYGYGEVADPNWEEPLRKAGISEVVIEKVREYFRENPEGRFEDDEDSD